MDPALVAFWSLCVLSLAGKPKPIRHLKRVNSFRPATVKKSGQPARACQHVDAGLSRSKSDGCSSNLGRDTPHIFSMRRGRPRYNLTCLSDCPPKPRSQSFLVHSSQKHLPHTRLLGYCKPSRYRVRGSQANTQGIHPGSCCWLIKISST